MIAALVVIVVGSGVYLWRSGTHASPTATAIPPGGAVAVVHNGPAVLASQSLTGGSSGATLSLSGSPGTMVTTPDGSKGFLLDSDHGRVLPIDLVNHSVGTPIPAGKLPIDEELSRDGATLYVTDNGGNAVIPINTATLAPQPPVQLIEGVDGFFPAPSGTAFLVTLHGPAGQPGIIIFYDPRAPQNTVVKVGLNSVINAAFSPDGSTVWVLEQGVGKDPGAVIPITVATRAVGDPIPVGHEPSGAVMSADGHTLVVSNGLDATATIIDLGKRTVTTTVPIGAGPGTGHFTSDGATVWIACQLDKTLVPIDMATDKAGTPVTLTNAPADFSLPRAGGTAWVLYPTSTGNVDFLSPPTFSAGHAIAVGNAPTMVIAHDSSTAWVANYLSDTVQHIDIAGNRAGPPIHVSRTPGALVLSADNKTLFVTSFGDGIHSGFVTAIDTGSSKAQKPLDVGPAPGALTLSRDGLTGYIASHQANAITTIDIALWKVGKPIPLPCSPSSLVITPDSATAYADCAEAAQVFPITTKTNTVGAPIAVGAGPSLLMSNHGKFLFVNASHQVQVISIATNTVIQSHDETGNIVSLAPTPDDTTLVAVDNAGSSLVLLNTTSLTTTKSVSLGTRPEGIRLSPDGSRAYVLDTSAQKLYVVNVAAAAVTTTLDVSPNAQSVAVPAPAH